MPNRIAILGFSHESNTFISTTTSLQDFKDFFWLKGNAITEKFLHAHHEIGGMIESLEKNGFELIPVFYAAAQPGGAIEKNACRIIIDELLEGLRKSLPLDGCLFVAHGAAVGQSIDDLDGYWLSQIRKTLGELVPIIGTLDPHANLSQLMINSTDGLIAYKTNPHIDQRETGIEAAELMISCITQKRKPVQFLLQLPMVISIDRQHTGSSPCKELFDYAKILNQEENILSVNVLFGFPYADVEDMGSSVLVIADKELIDARTTAARLGELMLTDIKRFNRQRENPLDLISRIREYPKPVLLLDMGDNVGGGAPGNSTYLLELLQKNRLQNYFICIHDPEAVSGFSSHEFGDQITLSRNSYLNKSDEYIFTGRVKQVANGQFTETEARHDGLTEFDMGKIAVLETSDKGLVMFTSLRTPPYSLRQLTAFEIDPVSLDFIVAKGVNAPIAAYEGICKTILPVDSPGMTQADLTGFCYSKRRKPMFPFEPITN